MLRVCHDIERLSAALARSVAGRIAAAVHARGSCTLVLSGGRTPGTLYRRLAAGHAGIPWARVHVFWGDERDVPPDDERSNYRMACDTLLDHVAVPPANVHRMPTGQADPVAAAAAYEEQLRTHFETTWPRFDIVLLGLGQDGHTASLFPGSPALDEAERWVVAVAGPSEPRTRLTLTPPAIIHAASIDVVASGASKADALRQALTAEPDYRTCPASAIRRTEGALTWWADEAAAALVQPLRNKKGI